MLRIALLSLILLSPTFAATPVMAEQASGSGLPAPETKKQWQRAVQLRLNANIQNRLGTRSVAGLLGETGTAALSLRIAPDGAISDVGIARSSGSAKIDESLLRTARALPRMPAFAPDMARKPIMISFPVQLHN